MSIWKHAHQALIASVAMLVAACASGSAGAAPPPTAQPSGPQTAQPATQSVTALPADYRLDAGDQLKITVFGEPDLSGTFIVDGQGVVSMSLIGEVVAKNLTLRELQRVIETKLKDGYLKEPQVAAEVVNYRPFYILGEVNKPGEYPYIAGLTLMNAIASAGDFTYRADKRKVFIKRKDADKEQLVEVTPSTTIRPGDSIRVRERLF